ncbi:MAG: permease of the major facilitator superfamily, partial [Pedosphaera sp.]|nr:permease of the major facilitator superfamily [Pedosphaera sp.]
MIGLDGLLLLRKQRLRVLLRVERLQIIRLFAEADEFDGQAQFFLNRHHHAAIAGAVQFGHHQAGQRHGLVEFPRLGQGVHAGR